MFRNAHKIMKKNNIIVNSIAIAFVAAAGCFSIVGASTDTTPPVAAPAQTPAANVNGWNNTDVTVNWNWTDSGSGINPGRCTMSSTSSGEGAMTLKATCEDFARNLGRASYAVKVDKTLPFVKIQSVEDSYGKKIAYGGTSRTQDVTVNFVANDSSSGLAYVGCGRIIPERGIQWVACTSPYTFHLRNGTRNIYIKAIDNADNANNVMFSLIVDAKGAIKVLKKTVGSNGTFGFTGDLGAFSITTYRNTGSKIFNGLEPGQAYSVSETSQTDWALSSNGCVNVVPVTDQTVTCTITNTVSGQ